MHQRLQVVVGCECSGAIRREIAALGHLVVSVDLKPAEDKAPPPHWHEFSCTHGFGDSRLGYHHQGDLFNFLRNICGPAGKGWLAHMHWDLGIFHPDCTFLANSGVQHLHRPDSGPDVWPLTGASRWRAMREAAAFYKGIRGLPIEHKAIENPVMHGYASDAIGAIPRDIVQPYFFGDKLLKATGWELYELPRLVKTSTLVPPTDPQERKTWAVCHNMAPTKDPEVRKTERSRTPPLSARAYAQQWCAHVMKKKYGVRAA